MRLSIVSAAACAALAMFALPGSANAKPATCEIVTPDGGYRGPCNFSARKGGSFELTFPAGPPDPIGVDSISLTVGKPGRGKVIAMYTEGGEDWGVFIRSTAKPACWLSAARRSRICVY